MLYCYSHQNKAHCCCCCWVVCDSQSLHNEAEPIQFCPSCRSISFRTFPDFDSAAKSTPSSIHVQCEFPSFRGRFFSLNFSKFHSCPRSFASRPTVHFSDNLSASVIILRYTSRRKGFIYYINYIFSYPSLAKSN